MKKTSKKTEMQEAARAGTLVVEEDESQGAEETGRNWGLFVVFGWRAFVGEAIYAGLVRGG